MEEYINKDTIIHDNFYELFKEYIICSICNNIFTDPVMCMNCQNVFCKKCTQNWSIKNKNCPYGCNNPSYQRSLGKNDILSKLKFNCTLCGNEILYDNVKKHYDTCVSNKKKVDTINLVSKIEKLSNEEMEKLIKKGDTITNITSKKKI